MSKNSKNTSDLTVRAPVNPDGKGVSDTLLDWYRVQPRGVVAKPQNQVLAEFFTSMLVLSARFNYKPVTNAQNYLYFMDGNWMLSLIAPDQWSQAHRLGYVGTCQLQADMTWTIEPSEQLLAEPTLSDAIADAFDAFAQSLDTDSTLEEILPFFVRRMPYWQRLYASGLSRSIRATVTLGDQASIKARDWQLALPSASDGMLAAAPSPQSTRSTS
ncbi:MAG: DUF2452 domain-containing protein [Gammaproteobacteria bacterium]